MPRWKAAFAWILLLLLAGLALVSCNSTGQDPTGGLPDNAIPPDFPLSKGTTWVYALTEYQAGVANPGQFITATSILTETVIETRLSAVFFLARVQRQKRILAATPGWPADPVTAQDFWYVIHHQLVYASGTQFDVTRITTSTLFLQFDLPLSLGKDWCLLQVGRQTSDCATSGKRKVWEQGSYQTPAGKFRDCFKITDDFMSNGAIWFCNRVGVVAIQYDQSGTPFGFRQSLIRYTSASP